MEQNYNNVFDDKARIMDLLNSEKQMTGVYNSFLCETETLAIRNCFTTLLDEEHKIQEGLFAEMKSRGWYTTEQAEQTKIDAAKQKFAQKATVG